MESLRNLRSETAHWSAAGGGERAKPPSLLGILLEASMYKIGILDATSSSDVRDKMQPPASIGASVE